MTLLGLSLSGELSVGELMVGIGTLTLAGVTWWLARHAGEEVELSRVGLDLTRDSIEAQDQPLLVADFAAGESHIDIWVDEESDHWTVSTAVTNWGKGIAVFDGGIAYEGPLLPDMNPDWRVEVIFAPKETRDLAIRLASQEPSPGDNLTMVLYYRSASGNRYATQHHLEVHELGRVVRLDFKRSQAGWPSR